MKKYIILFLILLLSSSLVSALKVISPYPINGNSGSGGGSCVCTNYLNQSTADNLYYSISNPLSYYNSTTLVVPPMNWTNVTANYLKLNQSTPQTIVDGAPNFKGGFYADQSGGVFDFESLIGVSPYNGIFYEAPKAQAGGLGMALQVEYSPDPGLSASLAGLAFVAVSDGSNGGMPGGQYGIFGVSRMDSTGSTDEIAAGTGGYFDSSSVSGFAYSVVALYGTASAYGDTVVYDAVVGGDFSTYTDTDATAPLAIGVRSNVGGTGTVTDAVGVLVEDVTVGTNNYAIQTKLGKVEFGDLVQMDNLIKLNLITLPLCNSTTKNYIGANTTGTYGCNSTNWVKLF